MLSNPLSSFDTLAYVKRLKAADVPEKQAEAQAEALRAALDTQDVATKGDLRELELKLRNDITLVRKDMDLVRKELGSDIALVRKDIDNLRWTVRIVLGGVIALLVRSFF